MLADKVLRRIEKAHFPKVYFGGLAQLGERYNGIVEVIGSSPLSSTPNHIIKTTSIPTGGFLLSGHLLLDGELCLTGLASLGSHSICHDLGSPKMVVI